MVSSLPKIVVFRLCQPGLSHGITLLSAIRCPQYEEVFLYGHAAMTSGSALEGRKILNYNYNPIAAIVSYLKESRMEEAKIFICSDMTILHMDRLIALYDTLKREDLIFCNENSLINFGYICLRAGVACTLDGILVIEKFGEFYEKGRRTGFMLYGEFPEELFHGLPCFEGNNLSSIRNGNMMVTQIASSSDERDSVIEALKNDRSRISVLLTEAGAELIAMDDNQNFVCLDSRHFGKYSACPTYLTLDWHDRPKQQVPRNRFDTEGDACIDVQGFASNVIPNVFHFIWLGGSLPQWAERNIETWMSHHPEWQVRIWTDECVEEALSLMPFIDRDWFYELEKPVLKSDILRMAILYGAGGVYCDVDFECYSNFLDQIPGGVRFGYGEKPGGLPECALLFATPGNPFFIWFIKKSYEFWLELDSASKTKADRESVVWPMNSFDRRIRIYYGSTIAREHLFIRGRAWAAIYRDVMAISDLFLHGDTDSIARHAYSHSWW